MKTGERGETMKRKRGVRNIKRVGCKRFKEQQRPKKAWIDQEKNGASKDMRMKIKANGDFRKGK